MRPLVTSGFATQPSFSPDGRRIAFIGFDAKGRMGIWSVGADGRGARPLRVVPGNATLFHFPVYSPDGRSLAFVLQGVLVPDRGDAREWRRRAPRLTRARASSAGVDWARA